MTITIQPSAVPDGVEDYAARQPYPFHCNETGHIARQDVWRGSPARVIGITDSPDTGTVTVTWSHLREHPEAMVGKYLVVSDDKGNWATLLTAVDTVTLS